jgi:hypothetical protein
MTKTKHVRTGQTITLWQLFCVSLAPAARRIRRLILQTRLRSLQRLAEYFEWEEANGRAGLADTHKRIALTKSELNALR